jgi:hypothetical protein
MRATSVGGSVTGFGGDNKALQLVERQSVVPGAKDVIAGFVSAVGLGQPSARSRACS